MRIEESLNVRFNESPPPKSSPLVDDDIIKSQIIENQIEEIEDKKNRPLNKDIINIKVTKDHPLEKVIEDATVGKPASIAILADLVTGASQSRQHESRKPPTKSLFDVGSSRISIVIVITKEHHSDVLAVITRIMRRTF
ncbi:hypothetical protein Tco_1426525 [Tanacetum coccineum]